MNNNYKFEKNKKRLHVAINSGIILREKVAFYGKKFNNC